MNRVMIFLGGGKYNRILKVVWSILLTLAFYPAIGNGSIWVDEAFSLELIQHSYSEIVHITAADVHPPLFYLLLKIIYGIIKLFPNINIIVGLKIFELLLFIVTIIFIADYLNKLKENGYLWLLCVLGLPLMFHYSYEIRMYSLAMIFVMLTYIFFIRIIYDDSNRDYCIFTIMSLGASYTHYYACIAVVPLYLLLLLKNLLTKKSITLWLKCTGFAIICYIPWLAVLLSTMRRIKENFHISELTWRTICSYWMSVFNPEFSNKYLDYIVVLIFTFILIYISFKMFTDKTDRSIEMLFCSLAGIIMMIWVIFIGVFVSIIFKPVFAIRYEVIVLPCFWMSFIMLVQKRKRLFKYIVTVLLIMFCLIGLVNNYKKEIEYKHHLSSLLNAFEWSSDFNENNKIITEYGNDASVTVTANSHINRTISCLMDCECYLWEHEETELSKWVYHGIFSLYDEEMIMNWLGNGKIVWFIGYDDNADFFKNINLQYVGHFYLEDYNFYLYKCSRVCE